MSTVTAERLTKVYTGGVEAVNDLDLQVDDGEFVVLSRAVRVRQDHGIAHGRGAGGDHIGHAAAR